MIYITIILVAVIVAGCALGCKYIDKYFDPDLYESVNRKNIYNIIKRTLYRCYKYEVTTGDDKYKYSINEQEIADIMRNIAYSLNMTIEQDYEYHI